MMKFNRLPYKSYLIKYARELRNNMTLSEVLLWQEIKGHKLGFRFSRQIAIDNFIVDFYSKQLKLAIEIDGDSHYHGDQPAKDALRQKRLEELGVKFIRFDDKDVKNNMAWVLNELQRKIDELAHP